MLPRATLTSVERLVMSQVYRMAESATVEARGVVTLFRRMARMAMLGSGQSGTHVSKSARRDGWLA
jgi:hypothetical protein